MVQKRKTSEVIEPETLYGTDIRELSRRLLALEGTAILEVVELIRKSKTPVAKIFEDVTGACLGRVFNLTLGEFGFDLYTLSPQAIKALWDFTNNIKQ